MAIVLVTAAGAAPGPASIRKITIREEGRTCVDDDIHFQSEERRQGGWWWLDIGVVDGWGGSF